MYKQNVYSEYVCACRLEGQILVRFEEENGGRLLIATLCLLEVSARGLLEVELLAVLGDEDHLMPNSDVGDSEKDDEESVGKSEQAVSRCHWYLLAGPSFAIARPLAYACMLHIPLPLLHPSPSFPPFPFPPLRLFPSLPLPSPTFLPFPHISPVTFSSPPFP